MSELRDISADVAIDLSRVSAIRRDRVGKAVVYVDDQTFETEVSFELLKEMINAEKMKQPYVRTATEFGG